MYLCRGGLCARRSSFSPYCFICRRKDAIGKPSDGIGKWGPADVLRGEGAPLLHSRGLPFALLLKVVLRVGPDKMGGIVNVPYDRSVLLEALPALGTEVR